MIDESINLLKGKLDTYLRLKMSANTSDKVAFVSEKNDALVLTDKAINIALLNVHEESLVRINSFQETPPGQQPNIGINLDIFFIAAAKDNYREALQLLSHTVQFFKDNKVFDHENSPTLHKDIWRLIMELQSFDISNTREAWQVKNYVKNKPAVFYRVKLLIFTQSEPALSVKTTETSNNLQEI